MNSCLELLRIGVHLEIIKWMSYQQAKVRCAAACVFGGKEKATGRMFQVEGDNKGQLVSVWKRQACNRRELNQILVCGRRSSDCWTRSRMKGGFWIFCQPTIAVTINAPTPVGRRLAVTGPETKLSTTDGKSTCTYSSAGSSRNHPRVIVTSLTKVSSLRWPFGLLRDLPRELFKGYTTSYLFLFTGHWLVYFWITLWQIKKNREISVCMIFTIPVHFFIGGISYLIYVSSTYAFKAQVTFIICTWWFT
jgi:hypothetical protein